MKKKIAAALACASLMAALPALAQVVVVVNPKSAESSMTKDEVAQFFLGK
jgi:ABC-type phosphate transport system substrate-binding protein